MTWADRREELHDMIVVQRLTFTEAGIRMGASRSAIAGACSKLGIECTRFNPQSVQANHFHAATTAKRTPPHISRFVALDPSTQIPLKQAGIDHCRFISGHVNGAETIICGAETLPRPSRYAPKPMWCAYHNRIVHERK